MSTREKTEKVLRHPFTAVTAGMAFVLHGLDILGALFGALGATAGLWFPLLGVMNTLGTVVGAIPTSVTTPAFIGGAVLYAVYLTDSLWDSLTKRLKERLP